MACQSCRQQARRLASSLQTASELSSSASTRHFSASSTLSSRTSARATRTTTTTTRRQFSHSAWRGAADTGSSRPRAPPAEQGQSESGAPSVSELKKGMAKTLAGNLPRGTGSVYLLGNQLEALYKQCSTPAAYTISEELQKSGDVPKTSEGEELGTPDGPWLETFNLSPSFSSWSHVTMLHMYLIITRMRCLERRPARHMQAQFVDNFFFDCERVMHLNHGMVSSALRQRYLKDIFTQWRGLVAAYDEGVARGSDRVLGAALWRNLFKAREDADPRAIAAMVAWMRATMRDLEGTSIDDLLAGGSSELGSGVFRRDPRSLFRLVDEPSPMLKGVYGQGAAGASAGPQ